MLLGEAEGLGVQEAEVLHLRERLRLAHVVQVDRMELKKGVAGGRTGKEERGCVDKVLCLFGIVGIGRMEPSSQRQTRQTTVQGKRERGRGNTYVSPRPLPP